MISAMQLKGLKRLECIPITLGAAAGANKTCVGLAETLVASDRARLLILISYLKIICVKAV